MLKAKVSPLLYADKSKVCCMLYQPTVVGTGTLGEIALAAVSVGALGLNATIGYYNKFCSFDFPLAIKSYDNKLVYQSYDVKTGLLITTPLNGSA